MTVETNKSKTAKQVMGSYTYDFDFECLLQDPTEEKAKQAIKVTISDGDVETPLTYGSDYTVVLNSDGYGGTVTVADAKDNSYSLVIYREYELTQGSEYQDYNAFPAKTVEGNMDKNLMIAQQQQEQLDRCVQMGITSDIDPATVVAQVERVYSSIDNVDIVAYDLTNIDAVAGNATNINAVANNATNINAVNANATNINAVNANKTNINTVAGNISNVNAVANISSDVSTVAGIAADVTAVKNNASNINAVAADLENINSVAADLTNIDNASRYASNANVWAEGTDQQVQALGGVHSSRGWAEVSAQGQIQADWNQVDNTQKDFIKNKPTKLSDFTDSSATTPIARATADASGNTITATYETKAEAAEIIPTLLKNYGRPDFIHAKLLNSAYEGETYVEMWTDGATGVFDKTTLQIEPCVIKLTVDGVDRVWHNTSTIDFVPASNLDSGSSLGAGKNYNIYLVPEGTGCKLIVSLNASYPSGYTATNSRKIGWFHTLCVAAGTISGHLASGYSAGDIIPNSVACLSFRPKCDPSGMAYIDIIDSWVDIYLQSGTGANTASVYGGTITDTRYFGNHCRDMAKVGKTLPSSNDFSIFAFGSNEKTNISGSADPVTTGGHKDTNNRRMISQYFIEDCCGALWQWLNDEGPCGGSNWTDITLDDNASSSWYGSLFVLLAGGPWGDGAHCGSGCRFGINSRSALYGSVSARGLSRNLAKSIA